jgi:hypothetical protein
MDEVLDQELQQFMVDVANEDSTWEEHEWEITRASVAKLVRHECRRCETQGAKWMFQPDWNPVKITDKIHDAALLFLQKECLGIKWEATQKKGEASLWGFPVLGYADGLSDTFVEERKTRGRREGLRFMDHAQASIYAHLMNQQMCRIAYIVPWTKEVGYRTFTVERLGEEVLVPLLQQVHDLKAGRTPGLNPGSQLCRSQFCDGFHDCIIGKAKMTAGND